MHFRAAKLVSVLMFSAVTGSVATSALAAARPGMAVKDSSGASVGTVVAVSDNGYTIRTDKHDILVPSQSFTEAEGNLLIAMSQGQLNAAFEQAQAAASAALVVGASVKGAGGTPVGKISKIDEESVIIVLDDGAEIALPRSGIAGGADGAVIGLTLEQLRAQIDASKGAN